MAEHLRWGDAFAIVYSVCDRRSFLAAAELLALLERTRLPGCAAVTLLGNKRDLEHARLVQSYYQSILRLVTSHSGDERGLVTLSDAFLLILLEVMRSLLRKTLCLGTKVRKKKHRRKLYL